jgi:hypothetical protein
VTTQEQVGRFGQVVEDVGLAIQDLRNEGRGLDARKVELVIEHHAGDVVRALAETFPAGRIEPRFVLLAADAVITQTTALVLKQVKELKKQAAEAPLAVLGQGDYRRDIKADPPMRVRSGLWSRFCARAARLLGAREVTL